MKIKSNKTIDTFLKSEIKKFKKQGAKIKLVRFTPLALMHIKIPFKKGEEFGISKYKNIISVEVIFESTKDIRIVKRDAWMKTSFYEYDSISKFKKGFIRNVSNKL